MILFFIYPAAGLLRFVRPFSRHQALQVKQLENHTVQKMKFSIKDLVTFTEEMLNGKRHFCAVLVT